MMQANSLTVGCHTCRWESVDLPLDRHESYSFTWPIDHGEETTNLICSFVFSVIPRMHKNGRFLPLFLGCQQKRTGKVTV